MVFLGLLCWLCFGREVVGFFMGRFVFDGALSGVIKIIAISISH